MTGSCGLVYCIQNLHQHYAVFCRSDTSFSACDAINKVIRARLEELFLLLRQDVIEYLSDGSIKEVILTGGTSKLSGICELAEGVMERPCSIAKFDSSVSENLRHPEFATALGLLEYARMKETNTTKKKGGLFGISKIFKF